MDQTIISLLNKSRRLLDESRLQNAQMLKTVASFNQENAEARKWIQQQGLKLSNLVKPGKEEKG